MIAEVVLTVAEGKRLIAKAVVQMPVVKQALQGGIVAVAKGTTNSYIVEELLGERIQKEDYVTGATLPAHVKRDGLLSSNLPDLVLKKGQRIETTTTEVVKEMQAGDVFIKGANALNYELGQAGILIGHPTGGTIGAVYGTIIARRIKLVIPVGLEKNVPVDIVEAAGVLMRESSRGPTLFPVAGEIVTEIEAIALLAGAEAMPIAAGGVAGAEGATWFAIRGSQSQVEKALTLISSIQREPHFV